MSRTEVWTETLPPPPRWPSSLRSALLQLALLGSLVVGVTVALVATTPLQPRWPFHVFTAAGALYVAAGLLAWARRPSNGTGALLSACGLSVLAAALGNTAVAPLVVVGNLVAELPIGVLFHLLLAYPSGRLPDAPSRWAAGAGYVVTGVLHVPQYLWSGDPRLPGWLDLGAAPEVVATVRSVQGLGGAVVTALTVWLLVRRLRRADRGRRRGLAAVYGYGVVTVVFMIFSARVLTPLVDLDPLTLFELQIVVFAGVPLAFVTGVLRGGFARTREVEDLAAWLGTAEGNRTGLREALRSTLGDPSLELLFWLPEQQTYVDGDGRPVQATTEPDRRLVEVTTASGRVGAVVHDATSSADAALVARAGRVVALALERERLTAELRASRDALVESRSRLVESGELERRRIARDLHDGLQGRLVVLALRAGQLADRVDGDAGTAAEATRLRADLETAIAELRRLVHGVLPALLLQRGLAATVEELLDQTPLRSRLDVRRAAAAVPAAVETAGYFVVAEALANAVKHARAREVHVLIDGGGDALRVEVRDDGVGGAALGRGSGLRGLCDRVEALGGRMRVDSPPGSGTRVAVELPCG